MPDYLPAADAEFAAWAVNFVAYVGKYADELGLEPWDYEALVQAGLPWRTAYAAHLTASAAASSARQTKDDARERYERGAIRPLVRRLQASTALTDAQRQAMGIPVRDAVISPVGPPVSRPVVTVDAAQRLRHTIHFADEGSPTSKAKPAGCMGCEVWVKIGEPPVDPSELTFLALDTRSPYTADYSGAEGGQLAHYLLRWVSTRGDKGPWSQTVSATIGA